MVSIGERFLEEFDEDFFKELPNHPFKKGSNLYNYIFALDDSDEPDHYSDAAFWRDYHKARKSGLADPFVGIPFYSTGWRANEKLKKFAKDDPKDPYSSVAFGILSMSYEYGKRARPVFLARKCIRKAEGKVQQEIKHVYDYSKDKERIAVVHQIGEKKHTTERHYNHRTGKLQDYDEYFDVEKNDEWWFDYEWKKRIGKLNKKIEDYRRKKLDEYLDGMKSKKEYRLDYHDRKSRPLPALYPSIYLSSSDDSDNDECSVIRRRKKKYPKVCTEPTPLSKQMRDFREGLDYLQKYL